MNDNKLMRKAIEMILDITNERIKKYEEDVAFLNERVAELSSSAEAAQKELESLKKFVGGVEDVRLDGEYHFTGFTNRTRSEQEPPDGLDVQLDYNKVAHDKLSAVCNILFADDMRAETHAYNGIVERAKEVMEAATNWTKLATPVKECSTCREFYGADGVCMKHKRHIDERDTCYEWTRGKCLSSICRIYK